MTSYSPLLLLAYSPVAAVTSSLGIPFSDWLNETVSKMRLNLLLNNVSSVNGSIEIHGEYMFSNKFSNLLLNLCGNMWPVWKHYYGWTRPNTVTVWCPTGTATWRTSSKLDVVLDSGPSIPWYENMTSSTKPEIHSVSRGRQRRTEQRRQTILNGSRNVATALSGTVGRP